MVSWTREPSPSGAPAVTLSGVHSPSWWTSCRTAWSSDRFEGRKRQIVTPTTAEALLASTAGGNVFRLTKRYLTGCALLTFVFAGGLFCTNAVSQRSLVVSGCCAYTAAESIAIAITAKINLNIITFLVSRHFHSPCIVNAA